MTSQFVAGSQFWPATLGPWMWREYRRDVVSRDLEAALHAGISHLDVSLLWTDLQPDATRVDVSVLKHFEHFLQTTSDIGIRVRPCLLPTKIGDDSWVPEWALFPHGRAGHHVVTRSGRAARLPRSQVTDLQLRTAQTAQITEVVRLFTQHPAVSGWILGDRIVTGEVGAEQLHVWLADTINNFVRAGGAQPVWHGLSGQDAIRLPLAALGLEDLGIGLILVDDWRPTWARDSHLTWAAFLAYLGVGLLSVPVAVAGLRQAEPSSLQSLEAGLEAIWDIGADGCVAESLFDYSEDLRNSPPFDREPGRLRQGLIRLDGTPKASAGAWAKMARRIVRDRPRKWLDAEYYERDPEGAAREYFMAFCDE